MLQYDPDIDDSAVRGDEESQPARHTILNGLTPLITELNIARKNRIAYPPGHAQLVRSIQKALGKIKRVLDRMPDLTFEVGKDRLTHGDDPVAPGNQAVDEYTRVLYRFGIDRITFFKGLDAEELERFHQLLAMDPQPIWDAGGIETFFNQVGFDHIRIREIDYQAYRVTEGIDQKTGTADAALPETGGRFRFLKRFWAKIRGPVGRGDSGPEQTPAEVARWLNDGRLDPDEVLAHFDHCLTEQIVAAGDDAGEARQTEAVLDDLNELLKNLKPGLRRQFLSLTFNRLANARAPGIQDEVLGGLSDEMVIEMLRHVNEADKMISPALVRLVQKMSWARGLDADGSGEKGGRDAGGQTAGSIPVENMRHLFEAERYEKYVDAEYDSLLQRVSGNGPAPRSAHGFNLKHLLRTFREDRIDHQLNALLLSVVDNEEDPEIYRAFSQNVVSAVPKLLDRGDFKFLLKIFAMFNRHIDEHPIQEIRFLAERSLGILQTPEFLNRAAAAFQKWSGEKGFEISDLCLAIGSRRISKLIDIYGRNAYHGDLDALLSVLAGFGPVVLDDVYSRLADPRSEYVLNMIHLLGAIGNRRSLAHLKPLLSREDPSVRFAALEVFLKFKDPGGIKMLRRALRSPAPEEFGLAVTLAADYRLVGVVPDLLSMIKIKPLRKSDFKLNAVVIRTLGKIGHVSAVPTLEKLVSSKWSLYPQRLSRMKETVYESLEGYPYEHIRKLITCGEKSDSDRIQRLCAELVGREFHSEFI
jgi:hypothetical protein